MRMDSLRYLVRARQIIEHSFTRDSSTCRASAAGLTCGSEPNPHRWFSWGVVALLLPRSTSPAVAAAALFETLGHSGRDHDESDRNMDPDDCPKDQVMKDRVGGSPEHMPLKC